MITVPTSKADGAVESITKSAPDVGADVIAFPATSVPTDNATVCVPLASGTAYAIGTMLDVYVFQHIREKYTQAWWAAPAISTVVANVIDTYAFFYTAFYPAPWVADVAFNNTLTKIVIGLIVFLPAYGLLLSYLKSKFGVDALVLKDEVVEKPKAKKKAPAKKKATKK